MRHRKQRPDSIKEKIEEEQVETKDKIALVVSAIPLSSLQQKEIQAFINNNFEGRYKLDNRVDQSVIGGMYIKIKDRLIDATLRAKIDKLRERLLP